MIAPLGSPCRSAHETHASLQHLSRVSPPRSGSSPPRGRPDYNIRPVVPRVPQDASESMGDRKLWAGEESLEGRRLRDRLAHTSLRDVASKNRQASRVKADLLRYGFDLETAQLYGYVPGASLASRHDMPASPQRAMSPIYRGVRRLAKLRRDGVNLKLSSWQTCSLFLLPRTHVLT